MSLEYKEMTQKLVVLEVFSKRKSVSTPCGHCYRLESGFCLHLITQRKKEKKYVVLLRSKWLGWFSSVKNQCEVLLPGLRKGEGVGEEKLFSSPISLKFPFF